MPTPEPADVPIFVLCGGLGSRLGEIASSRPKPMLDIGEKPMLLHIMGWYARFGFRRFVLCTGHRSEVISGYFANFAALNSDFTVDLADRSISYHQPRPAARLGGHRGVHGRSAMTGARIARAAGRYLGDAQHFGVTYGDGLTDADLGDELRFHLAHDRLGTVLGVQPPSPVRPPGAARGRQRQLRREAEPHQRGRQRRLLLLPPRLPRLSVRPGRLCAGARAAAAADRQRGSSRSTGMVASGPASTRCATARWCRACGKPVPHPGRADGRGTMRLISRPLAGHAAPRGRAARGPARLLRPLLLPRGARGVGHRLPGSSRPTSPSRSALARCAACTTSSGRVPRPRS